MLGCTVQFSVCCGHFEISSVKLRITPSRIDCLKISFKMGEIFPISPFRRWHGIWSGPDALLTFGLQRHNWKLAQVVNSHLVCDLTIWQPGFDLPRQQWSPLNRFRTEQWHCGAYRRIWQLKDTDLCPCGKNQTMFHIVESCRLTKLNGGISRLHSADEDAVSWLSSYGSWHTYEKKKKWLI